MSGWISTFVRPTSGIAALELFWQEHALLLVKFAESFTLKADMVKKKKKTIIVIKLSKTNTR